MILWIQRNTPFQFVSLLLLLTLPFLALPSFAAETKPVATTKKESPVLVKTMAVQPPKGVGDIRLVCIGNKEDNIDLQPCGGTHVARTGEIGALRLGKIEKKGRMNRRIYVHLES